MGYRTAVRAGAACVSDARTVACIVALLVASGPTPDAAGGEPSQPTPASVGVAAPDAPPDESRYVSREVPDIVVRTAAGETPLSALWSEGPLVLTMVFTRCAGICSPYLRALLRADEALNLPDDVRRVVLSFDPRDTPDHMRRTGEHLGVAGRPGWVLGVAAPRDVDRLARALGFWFEWDEALQQFDHPALLVGIHQGRVARLLVGGSVTAVRLGEVVREARGQFIPSYPLPGDVLFRCFDYDPVTGTPTFAWGALVLLVPPLGTGIATLALFGAARTRRRPAPAPSRSPGS